MKTLIRRASFAALILGAAPAWSQTTTDVQTNSDGSTTTTERTTVTEKHGSGAAVGVAGGAVAGAVVAGPIGAAVGAVAGGVAGAMSDPPKEVKTYVRTQHVQPASYDGPIVVGDTLPDTITTYDVPKYDRYRWANLNGQRVLIDEHTHKIVSVDKGDQ